ncbi:hypothetical protein Aperf_G00000027778 [Anoplocephala perfoliata]
MDGPIVSEKSEEQSCAGRNNGIIRGRGSRPTRRPYYGGFPNRNTTDEPNQNHGDRYRGGDHRRNRRHRFNAYHRNARQNDPIPLDLEKESQNGMVSSGLTLNPNEDESFGVAALENRMKDLTLRESMMQQLQSGTYDCTICFLPIKQLDEIWSCDSCYGAFHLTCITKWAFSGSKVPENSNFDPIGTWCCPLCQKLHSRSTNPLTYRCFCGKAVRPEYRPGISTMPHGCDEVCGKSRASLNAKARENPRIPPCPHNCTELCHPGPCPPCTAMVWLTCPCGRVVKTARCGDEAPLPCGAPCRRPLDRDHCAFGIHCCSQTCHDGECPPCDKLIKSVCYCGRLDEVTRCGSAKAKRYNLSDILSEDNEVYEGDLEHCDVEMFFDGSDEEKAALLAAPEGSIKALFVGTVFSCEKTCDRPLDCGHHNCTDICHAGDCKSCPLLPENCLTCPCGRVPLSKLVMNGDVHGNRRSCIDPIPVCPNVCGRPNPICGHPCPEKCHPGPKCPPCKLTTQISCRCGKSSKEIPCLEYALAVKNDPASIQFLCNRVCSKKKSCGRHKCNRKCCDMVIHACQEICGRTLACGKHNCEDICHAGPCGSCWRGVINEDIYCYCGATYLSPPQPCGTKPPECNRICTREHACDHPVRHNCHSDPECPKCTELTTKRCLGDHKWMYNIPCFITSVTCGGKCNKPIAGCSHRCKRVCHAGECLQENEKCAQPCITPRPDCGHPCSQPCHGAAGISCEKAYGSSKCQAIVDLTCACGLRKEGLRCYKVKALVASLTQKDPNFLLRPTATPGLPFGLPANNILPCDNSCAMAKRLAEGKAKGESETAKMWVRGAQATQESVLSGFPPPEFSEDLKRYASNNISFATEVENILCNIVQQAMDLMKSSTNTPITSKVVTHNFEPMQKGRRWFIKELAEFYGVQCVELDPKPNTFVQAIAKAGWAKFPGGDSKQNCVTLHGQIQSSFVGSVKLNPDAVRKPVHAAQRSAFLRFDDKSTSSTNRRLLPFSEIASEASKTN